MLWIVRMTWNKSKTVAGILGASLLAVTVIYFLQQNKIKRLATENDKLALQQKILNDNYQAALKTGEAKERELALLQKNMRELLQLRNEVGQLRKERDAAKLAAQKIPQPVVPPGNAALVPQPFPPGTYITKDQLAFAGYDTPEAALQSIQFALIKGSFEMMTNAMDPKIWANDPDPEEVSRKNFARAQKQLASFKGFQILAKKITADGRVEIKVRMELEGENPATSLDTQKMIKVGNEWKMTDSSREYNEDWDKDGQIQNFVP
ncbi:MAG: hypothetical protein M3Y82_00420 [Verrucomicrobiota bacterium]|nr:hypothetical protein [Verrucomicrobiota bacterium]